MSSSPPLPEVAVRALGLRRAFGINTGLDGFDLDVPTGTVCGLLGPNGAGKTTAIRILTTLLRPDSGQAQVAGFDVVREPRQVRYRIGLVGQNVSLDEVLSGRENLVMFGRLLHLSARRPAVVPRSCSSSSISPRRRAGRWPATPGGCAGVSTWPRA